MTEQNQRTADELGEPDEIGQVLLFDEIVDLGIEANALVLTKRDTSPDGIWGKKNWGTTLYWDNTYTNDEELVRVVNPYNKYVERFYDTLFKGSTTTATWGTSGTLYFTSASSKVAVSTPIHYNEENIVRATLNVNGTNTSEADYYLSSDGGDNWESVNIGSKHTFSNVGQSLHYMIENTSGGAGTWPTAWGEWGAVLGSEVTITKLWIEYET